jgi:hypothetical protein
LEIKLDPEELRKKKLFVATPMYGGQCAGMYTKSSNDLTMVCTKHGIPIRHYYLFNESLITRARNYCVDEFLRSDYTHLLFIDSDIGFDFRDALTLLHLTGEDGYDIVTGPYPKKTIAWEKIKQAVEKGMADKSPFELENFVGDYVFNPVESKSFKISEPVEIKEGGTGFMMITREALEKYAEAYPELRYKPDHVRTEHFDGTKEITAFFDTVIDPESKRYLSEDYMFSQYARKIGLHIWMCPWMKLQHTGSYTFGGSLGHIAAIDASPTASAQSNQKNYKKNLTDISLTDINKTTYNMNRQQRRAMKKGN